LTFIILSTCRVLLHRLKAVMPCCSTNSPLPQHSRMPFAPLLVNNCPPKFFCYLPTAAPYGYP
jgi:hypothetical protein